MSEDLCVVEDSKYENAFKLRRRRWQRKTNANSPIYNGLYIGATMMCSEHLNDTPSLCLSLTLFHPFHFGVSENGELRTIKPPFLNAFLISHLPNTVGGSMSCIYIDPIEKHN